MRPAHFPTRVRAAIDRIARHQLDAAGRRVFTGIAGPAADDPGAPGDGIRLPAGRLRCRGRLRYDGPARAELLERWDAGLVRHPAERRMVVRASQQRAARLAGGPGMIAEVAALPSVAAVTGMQETPGPDSPVSGGDDDDPGELDTGAEDFYADAFEVLP